MDDLEKLEQEFISLLDKFRAYKASIAPQTPPVAPVPEETTPVPPPAPTVATEANGAQKWAMGIQQGEGYFAPRENENFPAGTPSWKNNNPGNLRYGSFTKEFPYESVTSSNFLVFKAYEDGFDALVQFVTNAAKGAYAPTYEPAMTLLAFSKEYGDPSNDGYADGIAAYIGVPVDTPIQQLIT